MNIEEYRKRFNEDDAVGWMFIDKQLKNIYNNQEPRHYNSALPSMFGKNPFDGFSIFDSNKEEKHKHFISYGMSSLYYDEDLIKHEFSRWGFELTFRIKAKKQEDEDSMWIIDIMNYLGNYVNKSGRWFEEYHFIPLNIELKNKIKKETQLEIEGIAFIKDIELKEINTPHGKLTFLQMVCLNKLEMEFLLENATTKEVEKLLKDKQKNNPYLINNI